MANNITNSSGVTYLISGGDFYSNPDINVESLLKFKDNIYGASVSQKQLNLIFPDKPTIEVKDPKGERDEDLEKILIAMFESSKMWAAMKQFWIDEFWFGASFFNPVWKKRGSEYVLSELRHLPSASFWKSPNGIQNKYSEILKGVWLNESTGEIEIYQTVQDKTTKLNNVVMLKGEIEESIAGKPRVLPLVPVLNMLSFSWKAYMQKVNRVGSPVLFMRIENPQAANDRNGNIDDVTYGNMIVQNWGKDTAYIVRENMSFVDPHLADSNITGEIISMLQNLVIQYFSPASFISKEGTVIGSSSLPEQDLLLQYLEGEHGRVADTFEPFFYQYLQHNDYPEDYTVNIWLPSPNIDRTEIDMKRAEAGFNTKSMSINERRELLGLPILSDEELAKIKVEFAAADPVGLALNIDHRADKQQKKITNSVEDELLDSIKKLRDGVLGAINEEKN